MLTAVESFIRKLPPPAKARDENVACLIGFLFGGIGLAIYLRTVVDFFLPIGIFIVLFAVYPHAASAVAALVIAALYGYFRVKIANESTSSSSE